MALPVTFGEPRRMSLFAYLALRTHSVESAAQLLQKFRDDHSILEVALHHYRVDCLSTQARRIVQTGLPGPDSLGSFISYGRGAHGLGLIIWERRGREVTFKPNWLTVVTQSLGRIFNYYGLSFELPVCFKLLMAQQLVTNDWDMTGAVLSSISKLEEKGLKVEKLASQIAPDYASKVIRNTLRRLESPRRRFDASSASNRVHFFEKNFRLLRSGQPATAGFRHQLEARLQWLIDLKFIDFDYLCREEKIRLSSAVGNSFRVDNRALDREREDILPEYASFLRNDYENETAGIHSSSTESMVETSISSLRDNYGKLIPADAVIYMTRILALLTLNRRLERNEILEDISRKHRVYRDLRGSGAFVE